MASTELGLSSLWFGDTAPDQSGVLFVDTTVAAKPRLKVQTAATGSGTGPFGLLDGYGYVAYADATVPGGNTVANTATETAFTSAYTIPANTLVLGSMVRVKMYGTYSTNIVAPTLTGKVKVGGGAFLNTGALTTIAGVTNAGWSAEAVLVVGAAGAGGSVEAQGYAEFSTAATTALSVNVVNTSAVAYDTTSAGALTVTVKWSAADPANTITLRLITVEIGV